MRCELDVRGPGSPAGADSNLRRLSRHGERGPAGRATRWWNRCERGLSRSGAWRREASSGLASAGRPVQTPALGRPRDGGEPAHAPNAERRARFEAACMRAETAA